MIAGVDEAGRGPLAGSVVAAAVILPDDYELPGLNDSKKCSEKLREKLFDEIIHIAISWAIAEASVAEIDSINILQASLLAMERAINGLSVKPTEIWVDGRDCPKTPYPSLAIIDGDALKPVISAASILAKVTRDRQMRKLAEIHPGYGFEQHKGYGTRQHMDALKSLGPCEIHRRSFAPVRQVMLSLEG